MHEPLKQDGFTDEDLTELLLTLRAPEGVGPRAGFYGRVMDHVESKRKNSIWSVFLEPVFSLRLAAASMALILLMGVALYTGSSDSEDQIAFEPVQQQQQQQQDPIIYTNENQAAPVIGAVNSRVDALHAAPVSLMGREQGREVVLVDLVSYQER